MSLFGLMIILGTFPYANNFRKGISVGAEEETEDEEEQASQEDEEMEVDAEKSDSLTWPVGDAHSPEDLVALSSRAVLWSVKCLGRPLTNLQVDECTITEVLRVSLLLTGIIFFNISIDESSIKRSQLDSHFYVIHMSIIL